MKTIMNTDHSPHTPICLRTIVKTIIIPLFFVVLCHAQVNKTVPPNMVLVEGGTFQMGNDHEYVMEKPVHRVSIKSFYMDKYEVTVKEYRHFCAETKRAMPKAPPRGWQDNNPISDVSWNDAAAYAAWAGKRLPTEAAWEFAARGGIHSKAYTYSGSNKIDEAAWYSENARNKLHTVGTKIPNELGLFDMTGNALEWCSDFYDDYYSVSPQDNPQGPRTGSDRVLRGGSYAGDLDDCRITNRFSHNPEVHFLCSGFRCAMDKE